MTADRVQLIGTPNAVEGVVELPADVPHYRLEARPSEQLPSVRARAFPVAGDRATVRVRVDPATPPGRYPVTLSLGDRMIEADLVVQESPGLSAAPKALVLRGAPSERLPVEVVFSNLGNVDVELRRSHLVGLLQEGALEAAFADAVGAAELDGQSRINLFGDALARRHAGFAAITVAEQGATVPPGGSAQPAVEVRLPDGLEPGHVYEGVWPLGRLRIPLRVTATGPGKRPTRRRPS